MPYTAGSRLPGERASKLGHLDIIKSELVNRLVDSFESPGPAQFDTKANWQIIEHTQPPLSLIFAVDGSKQTIRSDFPPYKEVSFVKTALLRLDPRAIAKLDPRAPHPMALKDIMTDAAIYHSTVFPLKGVRLHGMNNADAIRKIVYDSMRDASLKDEVYQTLKWLAYRKWTGKKHNSPGFDCPDPDCRVEIPGLPFDRDESTCSECGAHLYLTDIIGFHHELGEDSAPDSLSTSYMLIHETLMLFTGIRLFWEEGKRKLLGQTLFLKDGPLTLRAQYSKLVIPIREFLTFAREQGINVHIAGQEKTGAFKEHLDIIVREAPAPAMFLPDNEYIRREVQSTSARREPYGSRTNYGNKIFVKSDAHHHLVLSVPTGEYVDTKSPDQFIGLDRILSTVSTLVSHKHECALVPIELANGVASLSSYPSAAILKIFADV